MDERLEEAPDEASDEEGKTGSDLNFEALAAAYEGMPPGDPRWPPFSPGALEKAREALSDGRRWLQNGADSLAIRLQYGRGVENMDICGQFGISPATLIKRARFGKWSRAPSLANRQSLARHVWLAGLARQERKEREDPAAEFSPKARADLRAASAWETIPPRPPVWSPMDGSAHAEAGVSAPISEHALERESLLDNPANPDRTHRDRVAGNLERLIARLERQQREEAAKAAAETPGEGENPSNDGPAR